MTLGGRLRAWWWDYRQRIGHMPDNCVICREGLGARDGGIDLGNGDRVCSEACETEYERNVAW